MERRLTNRFFEELRAIDRTKRIVKLVCLTNEHKRIEIKCEIITKK